MATMNNIFVLRINSVAEGSISFGNALNVATEHTEKGVGGSTVVGDLARNVSLEGNKNYDPDVVDQQQVL
ncbi:MAG: spore germination protein [Firmicutes bacterium]|uniref:Spore germination protein gerPA/gerPF n=1 Tax=Melghirimyces thermohalophilus TaxID=1236220 RepID=A0A1G6RQH3_9BACL|nr:spore germination protein [Melghirimyces thermohalophilus]MDA8352989.1 spore germination protein [Bacillota bacterium]SDD06778.1 Spore germination protein gerPA/gerPF [Melghirimyces thermohalophilus]